MISCEYVLCMVFSTLQGGSSWSVFRYTPLGRQTNNRTPRVPRVGTFPKPIKPAKNHAATRTCEAARIDILYVNARAWSGR